MILGMASLLAIVVASVVFMHTPHTTSGLRLWNEHPDDIATDSVPQNLKGNELNTVPLGVGKRKVRKHTSYAHISNDYDVEFSYYVYSTYTSHVCSSITAQTTTIRQGEKG